ncbi:uncharacterized protein LOC144667257 [Oculina patagonica]
MEMSNNTVKHGVVIKQYLPSILDISAKKEKHRVSFRTAQLFYQRKMVIPFDCREVSSSQLSTLPVGVFSNLTNLRTLNLTSNNVQSLQDDVFSNLASLITLDLSLNNIQNLPADVFAPLNSLEFLRLDSNNVSNVTSNVFCTLNATLISLELSSNNIQNLHADVFSSLKRLQSLLNKFIEQNDVLNPEQFGFRPNSRTTDS